MNYTPVDGLFAVLAAVCAVSFLFFGFYIISEATRDKLLRPLFYLCLSSAVWSCCYMMYYLSSNQYAREIWQRFIFAGMLTFTFFLVFFVSYAGFIKNKKILTFFSLAVWLPPLLFVYKSIADNAVARDFPYGFWFLYTQILCTIYNFIALIFILIYHMKRAGPIKAEGRQSYWG